MGWQERLDRCAFVLAAKASPGWVSVGEGLDGICLWVGGGQTGEFRGTGRAYLTERGKGRASDYVWGSGRVGGVGDTGRRPPPLAALTSARASFPRNFRKHLRMVGSRRVKAQSKEAGWTGQSGWAALGRPGFVAARCAGEDPEGPAPAPAEAPLATSAPSPIARQTDLSPALTPSLTPASRPQVQPCRPALPLAPPLGPQPPVPSGSAPSPPQGPLDLAPPRRHP